MFMKDERLFPIIGARTTIVKYTDVFPKVLFTAGRECIVQYVIVDCIDGWEGSNISVGMDSDHIMYLDKGSCPINEDESPQVAVPNIILNKGHSVYAYVDPDMLFGDDGTLTDATPVWVNKGQMEFTVVYLNIEGLNRSE